MKAISWKQFGVITLIVLGLILAFSPVTKNSNDTNLAKDIANQILNKKDHITAEELGHMIIDKEPGILVVDVRSDEEYNKYHITPSINIPLDKLFDSDNLSALPKDKLIILYSNGGTHAAQAWVLLHQFGFKNVEVLLGGLNYWVDVYANPEKPSGVYADSEIFKYQYLISAGQKLIGNTGEIKPSTQDIEPIKIQPRRKFSKKKAADEGC